jgi:nucleoside 2-deoxyribosyltransferase
VKIYLAGPMRGYPNFNFPAFDKGAEILRNLGFEVFSPAERDRDVHGTALENNATGDEDKAAKEHGFSLREALGADTAWICKHADAIALLPNWDRSKGAKAELALANALGLKTMWFESDLSSVRITV